VGAFGTSAEKMADMIEAFVQLQMFSNRGSSRIAFKTDGKIVFVNPADVIGVEAQGNYVSLLHTDSTRHLLRSPISAMEEKLRPYGFIRIHRSALVNSTFVEEIRPRLTGEYSLRVKGGKEYTVTRTHKKNLKLLTKSWIGTDSFLSE